MVAGKILEGRGTAGQGEDFRSLPEPRLQQRTFAGGQCHHQTIMYLACCPASVNLRDAGMPYEAMKIYDLTNLVTRATIETTLYGGQ